MPYAKLSTESAILLAGGWVHVGNRSQTARVWGIDRHGQWQLEEMVFKPDGNERPVYLGTQGAFSVLAASSRITVRDGSAVTAGSIPQHSRIGETWFELPGEPPEGVFADCAAPIAEAIRQGAAFRSVEGFAVRRSWPSSEGPATPLGAVTETVKCGGSEYCLFRMNTLLAFISRNWSGAVIDVVDYCFAHEEGCRQFDRTNALLVSWHISALRAKRVRHRLSYESLQSTRAVFVENVDVTQPPVVRGGCACMGATALPAVQASWNTTSWSPVVGGFFIRGS